MPAFIDKSPYSGMEHWVDQNEDDQQRNYVCADVEPVLDYAKAMRAEEAGRRHMGDYDMLHFATIPEVVIVKLLNEYGVNVFDRNDYPKLFRLLNGEFAYLKTTNMVHTVKH
jgi:elongation factor P--beta-lysine ligase